MVAAVANYWMLLVIVPLMFIFIYARAYYIRTAREIKRIEVAGIVYLGVINLILKYYF